MKKAFFLFIVFAGLFSAAQSQTITITGTLRDYGLSGVKDDIIVYEVARSGYVLPIRQFTVPVGSTGVYRFPLPQTIGTDTTKARIYVNTQAWRGTNNQGVWVAVPHGTTASLDQMTPSLYIGTSYPVIVRSFTVVDSSGGSYSTDSVRIGSGLRAVAPTNGGGTPTIISEATGSGATYGDSIKVAHDIANGKGDADSLKAAYDSLAAHLARISATEQVADGAIQESDSASLHAQKFADRPTRTEITDTLNSNVVRSEVDPTATAKAQAVVEDSLDAYSTNGARGVSSTKRIFAQMDSITFLGEAGDVIDLSTGNNFRGTVSANDTLSFTNAVDGQVIQVVITNAGTHTLSWSGVSWPGGTQPVLTAVANKRSIYSFIVSGGMIHGVAVLNY